MSLSVWSIRCSFLFQFHCFSTDPLHLLSQICPSASAPPPTRPRPVHLFDLATELRKGKASSPVTWLIMEFPGPSIYFLSRICVEKQQLMLLVECLVVLRGPERKSMSPTYIIYIASAATRWKLECHYFHVSLSA